jgi:hypothetical protein
MKFKTTLFYFVSCLILFIIILKWIDYLIFNDYIKECFQNFYKYDPNTPLTNHTVNLPINTTFQCNNFCGPQSQCSITREQCTSDVDCYGCQPKFVTPGKIIDENIRGQNDAGKLTYNQTPTYSELTTDIGTQSSLYGKKLGSVPKMYEGVDLWTPSYDAGMKIFDKKMSYIYSAEPSQFRYMPTYPTRESVTGLFLDNGPIESNAYL